MPFHSTMAVGANHVLQQFSYANAGARNGASGFLTSDIGKVAIQTDNNTFYVLAETTPMWRELAVIDPFDTFLELTDTPGSYGATAGLVPLINGAFDALEFSATPAVLGPGAAVVDNRVVTWDGATGTIVQDDSTVTLTNPATFTTADALNLISTGDMVTLLAQTSNVLAQHGAAGNFTVLAFSGDASKLMVGSDVFSIETDESTDDTAIVALDELSFTAGGSITNTHAPASTFDIFTTFGAATLKLGSSVEDVLTIAADPSNDLSTITGIGQVDITGLELGLIGTNGVDINAPSGSIDLTANTTITLTAPAAGAALYAADYSAGFVDRSLVDKAFVDAGFIAGPGAVVDNRLVTWDGTTGLQVQDNSTVTLVGDTFTSTAGLDINSSGGPFGIDATSSNLTIQTITSGDLSLLSAGTAILRADGGDLTLQTTLAATDIDLISIRRIDMTAAGEVTLTSGGDILLTADDGNIVAQHKNTGSLFVQPETGATPAVVRLGFAGSETVRIQANDSGASFIVASAGLSISGVGQTSLTGSRLVLNATTTDIAMTANTQMTMTHGTGSDIRMMPKSGGTVTRLRLRDDVNTLLLNVEATKASGDVAITAPVGDINLAATLGVINLNTEIFINKAAHVSRLASAVDANTDDEVIIAITDTSVARTVTIQTADIVAGRIFIIKDESGAAGTNNITIETQSTETIDGSTDDVAITADHGVVRLYAASTTALFSW